MSASTAVQVGRSAIHGLGVFAARPIGEGERLFAIEGEVIDAAECERREAAGNVYIFWLDDEAWLDPAADAPARYLNHACAFNAVVEGDGPRGLTVRAVRALAPGEEVTIDYDFPEIYRLCAASDPACRRAECPLGARFLDGG